MNESARYKKQFTVTSGNIDEGSHLTVKAAMQLFQDMVTEQTKILKTDNYTLKDKYNAFWVVAKEKIVIDRMPFFNERFTMEVFPSKPSSRFATWNCIALDSDEEPLWQMKGEICILDFEKQNIMRIKSTCFPMDLDFPEPLEFELDKINIPENGEYIYTHKVRSSDIDMSHHTNNVKYNTMAINVFTCAELANMKIQDYQIIFISQSHEGDELEIYRAAVDNEWYIWGNSASDKRIVFAVKMTVR